MIVYNQKDGIFGTAFYKLNEMLKILHKDFFIKISLFIRPLLAEEPEEPLLA